MADSLKKVSGLKLPNLNKAKYANKSKTFADFAWMAQSMTLVAKNTTKQ